MLHVSQINKYTYIMKKILWPMAALIALFMVACQRESLTTVAPVGGSGSITRFATYQNYMYVLNMNAIQTFSLADPAKPALVHTLTTDYGLETVTVFDGALFIGATDALYIVGIDDPAAPVLLSKTDRLSVLGGGCDPVAVKGDAAYSTVTVVPNICGTASGRSALVVYNVVDRLRPVEETSIEMLRPRGLGYSGDFLFVCDETRNQVVIFDIKERFKPVETLFNIDIESPRDLIVYDNRLFVSTTSNFIVYDVSDLSNIRIILQIAR